MKGMTLENMATACEGKLYLCEKSKKDGTIYSREASSVVIDSRKAEAGGVFVATKGAKVDGHDYIPQTFDKDVLCVICEKEPESKAGNYILVEDSFVAIKKLAKYYKSVMNIKTVGIIGSVGKTSTKELVASVLKEKYNTVKTIGNFNNEVGVPLTVFSIRDEHETAVIEMGISDFGEMDRLADIVKPDICVMTNIGPCHLEYLHDLDGVLKAKTEVFKHMSTSGTAVLNGDDEKLSTVSSVNGIKPIFYGLKCSNDIYADGIVAKAFDGTDANIHTPVGDFKVNVPISGEHMVYNALAAVAVGLKFNMTLEQIKTGIESATTISGRSNVIRVEDYTLVDDCYNANPKSMKAAIDLLSQVKGRKVAILGDMFELGENEKALHAEIGSYVVDKKIDVLLLAGELSKNILDAVSSHASDIVVFYKSTTDELIELLSNEQIIKKGDTILIKASHGMNYSKIVDKLRN